MVRLQTPLGATRPSDPASPAEPTVNPPVLGRGVMYGTLRPVDPGEVRETGPLAPISAPRASRHSGSANNALDISLGGT